ncbi:MAG: histone H1-like repetitive region-containing protein [Acidimicrobiales bacterium]
MVTPENFTNAIMRGLADLRSSLEGAAARFEAEARKAGQAAEAEDADVPGRSTMAGDQLQGIVDMIRSEAVTVATQLADGLHEIVDDLCELVQDRPSGGEGTAATSTSDGPATVDTPAVETSGPNSAGPKKSGSKKAAAKKSGAKKASAKKTSAKKSGAKKATAKKTSAKKSGAKKSGSKKATAKKASAKKSGAK